MKLKTITATVLLWSAVVAAASAGEAKFVSEYSSLSHKDCKLVQSGVGFNLAECPSHGPYGVFISDDEATSFVSLKVKGKDVPLEPSFLRPEGGPAFSMPHVGGEKLEWRYQMLPAEKKLMGVIYRVADYGWKEGQSVLYVARFQGGTFCPLGVVKTNEAAQRLIDGGKACPKDIE